MVQLVPVIAQTSASLSDGDNPSLRLPLPSTIVSRGRSYSNGLSSTFSYSASNSGFPDSRMKRSRSPRRSLIGRAARARTRFRHAAETPFHRIFEARP